MSRYNCPCVWWQSERVGPVLGQLQSKKAPILWTSNALSKNSAYAGYAEQVIWWLEVGNFNNREEDLKECSRHLILQDDLGTLP